MAKIDGNEGALRSFSVTPGELLRLVYDGEANTRFELAELTGMSRTTANQRVEALLPSGLLVESGALNTGGRRASVFSFNDTAGCLLAADISASNTRVAITDLRSNLLATETIDAPVTHGPDRILTAVDDSFSRMLRSLRLGPDSVWGLGIGMPGPVEFQTGRPVEPPTMPGWDGFDVPAWFNPRYPGPVVVDQDTNVMALGAQRSQWTDANPLLMIKVGTGIGAGMINEGKVFRGAQGAAGDIGHLRLKGYREMQCRCGNSGCVEAIAGGWALIRDLQTQHPDTKSMGDLLRLLRDRDPHASRLVRRAGRVIGEAIAVMVSLLNPSTVVVGGALAHSASDLLAGIREIVYQRSLPLATRNLTIEATPMTDDFALIGAAMLVAEEVVSASALDIRLAEVA